MSSQMRAALSIVVILMGVMSTWIAPKATRGIESAASVAGGVFVPYQGNPGFSVLGQYVVTLARKWNVGGEIEYKSFAGTVVGVDDVDVQTVTLRAIGRYSFLPDGRVNPYVGAGIGVDINIFDADKVERERFDADINDVEVGSGILILAGLEIPVAAALKVFGECRVGADFQLTQLRNDDIHVSSLGGFTGLGGLRYSF